MAARFRRQILHLCGFLFLLLRTFFFLLSSVCSLCCGGKFHPFQPFGSQLCTGARLITESQQGSALTAQEVLAGGLKCSFIQIIPLLLLLHNAPGRSPPTPHSLSRLFFLNKIAGELPAPERLLCRAAGTEPSPSAALSPPWRAGCLRVSAPSVCDSGCQQVWCWMTRSGAEGQRSPPSCPDPGGGSAYIPAHRWLSCLETAASSS